MADENKEVVTVKEHEQEKNASSNRETIIDTVKDPELDKNDSSNRELSIDTPSKKRKRLNEEKQEKMLTIREEDKKMIIEHETKALSKLCADTKDEKIRKLIECYQQTDEGDIEEGKNAMLKLYEIENQESILKSAITFVTNDPIDINESEPEELADLLIASIRNRMAKQCSDCMCYYIVDREKRPKKFCSLCNVGMHDCTIDSTDTTRKGEMWFCKDCHDHFTEQIKPQMMKKHRNVFFKGFRHVETDKVNNDGISKMIKEVRRDSDENKTNEMEVEEVIEVVIKPNEEEPKKKDQCTKGMDTMDEDKNDNGQINKAKKICHFWITKKCKFGTECKYEHPTRCREHMDWGKCKKPNCKLAHPKMCRNMISDSYCSRSNCWFNHPAEKRNRYVFGNENHGQNFNQNQRGPKRQDNQNMQGNPNNGYPTAWQSGQGNPNNGYPTAWQSGHMDRRQYSNIAPFLAGPTPPEAYKDPNREMKFIRKMGEMLQKMTSELMNMSW